MTLVRRDFETRDELAVALADAVAADLNRGIGMRGVAALAVSGGSTPARFFTRLGKHQDVDWEQVVVTLVDERWVPETSERSNAGLVNEKMLQGPAAIARFVPLYSGGEAPDAAAIARSIAQLAAVPAPLDAVILGMGNDGHTASFFPGGDNLAAAWSGDVPVVPMRAPDAGEPRVTLSLPRLLATGALYLHIEGEEKRSVLESALGHGDIDDMPIRAVLRQDATPLTIFWCP